MMAAKLTAVLGNCKRTGRWKIRSHTKAFILFGNCNIDYRDAYADDELEEIRLDVLCLFGRAVFILPPGADVQPSAVSLLSSSKFDVEVTDVDAGLPSIKMETTTIFGMCRVQTIDRGPFDEGSPLDQSESSIKSNGDRSPAPELESALPPRLPPPALPPTEIAMGDPNTDEHADHLGMSRLEELDPEKAVLITNDTHTVHIAAGVPENSA